MAIGGYAGNVLYVNLTAGAFKKEPLDTDFSKFIGGYGTNCRMAYDLLKPGIDPLSTENVIIIGAGPLVGTGAPASSKCMVMTKWPEYGNIANGSTGGIFGFMLKHAGYDHLIITGKAEKPVYLDVFNDDVEICDAGQLWGKDTYQTADEIRNKHGDDFSVVAIGPAGERLVKISLTLVDKVNSWGKGGLGAVMGSKNLKAIAIRGTKGTKVSDPERFKKVVVPLTKRIKSHPNYKKWLQLGTMAGFDAWASVQGMSSKNWTDRFPAEEAYRLYGPDLYLKKIKKARIADPSCPVGCKDQVEVREGEFKGLMTYGSSFYGRLENFAARCNVGGFGRMVKCLDFCNRMGISVHTVTALIDWAVDLYRRGIITKKDTDGLELRWDFNTTMKLLEKVARKEGFGAILGEGYLEAILRIGRGCEKYAIHVKGMEPLHDARLNRLNTFDFHNVTNPRGAHSATGTTAAYMTRDHPASEFKEWCEKRDVPKQALERIFGKDDPPKRFNVGRLTVYGENIWALSNSLGLGCLRGRVDAFYDMNTYAELYSAVTGIEISPSELVIAGDRNFNLLKVLNVREGFSKKDDKFPEIWFEPLIIRGEKRVLEDYFGRPLTRDDCYRLLDDYYEERGWDVEKGIPTKQKLLELGLKDIAEDLERSNMS